MSKLLASGVAVSGASAAAVGGTYLMNRGNETSRTGEQSESNPDTDTTDQSAGTSPKQETIEFEDLATFKSGMAKSKCVSDYFGNEIKEESNSSIPTINGTSSPESSTFFKTTSSETYQSCLSINGKVTKYGNEDKWNGKLTWLWTFIRGDEGFINFNIAESSDAENEKLKFTGVFYLVGKKADGDQKWEIKYKKEVADNTPSDSTQLDKYFPKAETDLKKNDGDYWGFVDDGNKLNKSCKTSDCGTNPQTPDKLINKKMSFTKGDDQSKKLSGWSSNPDWWKKLYSDVGWELGTKIDGFYGEWTIGSSQ